MGHALIAALGAQTKPLRHISRTAITSKPHARWASNTGGAAMESLRTTTDAIVGAVRLGSFPASEEVLSTSIDNANIPALLEAIESTRDDLRESVRIVSRQEAGDVDGWILQAKRVQVDIAQCKEDARHIIREYERIEALRNAQREARNKLHLLQTEISFNEALEEQIQLISKTSTALANVDDNIRQQRLILAAQTLPSLVATIKTINGDRCRSLLQSLHSDLEQRASGRLKRDLDAHFILSSNDNEGRVQILQYPRERIHSPTIDSSQEQSGSLSLDQILEGAQSLNVLDDVVLQLSRRIDSTILPHLHRKSKFKITRTDERDGAICFVLSQTLPPSASLVSAVFQLTKYFHENCPGSIRQKLVRKKLSQVVPLLVNDWLDAAIPTELDDLKDLAGLHQEVSDFSDWLQGNQYEEAAELVDWADSVPEKWLSKRRAFSLDAVRNAFKLATGTFRQVERVEIRTANAQEEAQTNATQDEWADNWDEDDQNNSSGNREADEAGDDESDAWGFDTDDVDKDAQGLSAAAQKTNDEQDDEGDAWGWGDDDDVGPTPARATSNQVSSSNANGTKSAKTEERDMVLKENYTITDIPDYILEQIGRDLSDHERLSASPSTYFKSSSSPPTGLGSLPTLTLAMFRAIASTSYQSNFQPALSNMNIYNDTLFIASKLAANSDDDSPKYRSLYSLVKSEVPVLEKFARQAYTSELSTHRTVILDLLDTAQGFVSCTRSPYAETCETAISSTTDYIRSLYANWSRILSSSHLCQSIGSLANSMMRKIIEDIEDMEDISEPESRKLVSLCEPVSAMQNLFLVETDQGVEDEGLVSTIALHCPSYLRFQYLQQMLESNLVEIRYLWTDAGLSLEFRPDEVVDLIKALFAESPQRKSTINAIRSGM